MLDVIYSDFFVEYCVTIHLYYSINFTNIA